MHIFCISDLLSCAELRARFVSRAWNSLLGVLVLGAASLVPSATAQAPSTRPLQATDLYRVHEVREAVLSPHGRSVAYTVRRIHRAPEAEHESAQVVSQLYVVSASGREAPRLLTRPDQNARQPAWHPDGTHIAFVRPVQGTPQVFILPLSGGEPYQLTDLSSGARRPQWSPDGEQLLFSSPVPLPTVRQKVDRPFPSERPGRTAADLNRPPPSDTVLVLRHAQTLTPLDTLALGDEGRLQPADDTSRTLDTPAAPSSSDSLAAPFVDSLATLSSDSLHAVFDSLRLRPDTVAVQGVPDTVATPDGDLVQVRRWLNQRRKAEHSVKVSTRLNVQGERALTPTPTFRHHFVVDVPSGLDTRTPARPTPRLVTGGYRSYGHAEWLPGGSQLVVSGMPPTQRHSDRIRKHNLYVVDVERGSLRRLLTIDGYALTDPRLSADGSTIAFRARALSDTTAPQAELGLFALDGRSQPRFITSQFDRDVEAPRWSPDGWYLYATAPSRGGRPLYRFTPFARDTSVTGPSDEEPSMSPDQATSRDSFALDASMMRPSAYEQMTDEAQTVHSFDVTDATVTYAATNSQTPSALYTNTVSFNNERRLSSHNMEWLARRRLSTSQELTARHDTLAVNAWVTRPVPFDASRRYPTLIYIRGGPPGLRSLHTPQAWFERQYLAARGIGVVDVHPRGSTGYGQAYRRANFQNWGPGPAQDVLAISDSAAALSWTDRSRQALAGTSYGGTLTAWLLGQTDRFSAGVATNGIYDIPALLDEGRAWRVVPQTFGGYPWDGPPSLPTGPPVVSTDSLPSLPERSSPRTALNRNSPLTYAHQIQTPLLLLQGGSDRRVGRSHSERLYKRLKILGRPVEYAYYPGAGHDVSASTEANQRLDRLVRTYEFLARFLKGGPDVETAP